MTIPIRIGVSIDARHPRAQAVAPAGQREDQEGQVEEGMMAVVVATQREEMRVAQAEEITAVPMAEAMEVRAAEGAAAILHRRRDHAGP